MLETLLLAVKNNTKYSPAEASNCIDWSVSKKFSPNDFIFLNILKTDTEKNILSDVFMKCYQLNTSFSDTIQILELSTELVMIHIENQVMDQSNDISNWKTTLKKLRYPQTTLSDDELKSKLEKLPWPYGSKIKFERRGDRAGVEIKLFITGPSDLTKIISSLERVKADI